MFKLLLLAGIAYLVYVVFFKKSTLLQSDTKEQTTNDADEMIKCPSCGIYVSQDEAILSQSTYYCSQTCIDTVK